MTSIRLAAAAAVVALSFGAGEARAQVGGEAAPAEAPASPVAVPPAAVDAPAALPEVRPEPEVAPREPTAWWIAASGQASFLGDLIDRSTLVVRFGYGLAAGYRWERWGVFAQAEEDFWAETEIEFDVRRGVVNLGPGVDYFYWDDRVRASAVVGASILMSDTVLHDRGHVGLFLDLRPVGLRYGDAGGTTLQLDPLTFAVEAPVLGSPALVDVQYRFRLTLEYDL